MEPTLAAEELYVPVSFTTMHPPPPQYHNGGIEEHTYYHEWYKGYSEDVAWVSTNQGKVNIRCRDTRCCVHAERMERDSQKLGFALICTREKRSV